MEHFWQPTFWTKPGDSRGGALYCIGCVASIVFHFKIEAMLVYKMSAQERRKEKLYIVLINVPWIKINIVDK